ncbi:MAG TPA: LA2681 family HEPN domain-containing protein [Ignavibacteria bacterium]
MAYHGATSFGNYVIIVHNGVMKYSEEYNNESDFEFCIYLFRRSIDFFNKFRNNESVWNDASNEEKQYYLNYSLMAYTNYANDLYQCGRLLKSISELKFGVANYFPMAVGNMACKLITYAEYDYNKGHSDIFCNEAYQLLLEALEGNLHDDARDYFIKQKERLEKCFPIEFLSEPYKFEKFYLGKSKTEKNYRKWCLDHNLYLNTLNDVFYHSLVAHDCIHLPDIVNGINVGVKYHGLFNQLKQEYVSARFMIYDSINSTGKHYSDNDVYLYNTLDYPVYGLDIEKIKCAYRSLYSLFDRIAFFINDYFELGIGERDVSFKSIWERKKAAKSGAIDLKKNMTEIETYNHPLIGLYWLFKDIGKKEVKHDYLEPAIKQISDIRNVLEHRYLKVHDSMFFLHEDSTLSDSLAKSVYLSDFKDATMSLVQYAREAIILLVLAIHRQEQMRSKNRPSDIKIGHMSLAKYEDEWKQIF